MFSSLLYVLNSQHHYWHSTFERGKPIWCLSLLIGFPLKASFTSNKSVQQFCLFEMLWNVLSLFFEIWPFLRQYSTQHKTSPYRMLLLICTYCFSEMHGTWQKSLLHPHLVEDSFLHDCSRIIVTILQTSWSYHIQRIFMYASVVYFVCHQIYFSCIVFSTLVTKFVLSTRIVLRYWKLLSFGMWHCVVWQMSVSWRNLPLPSSGKRDNSNPKNGGDRFLWTLIPIYQTTMSRKEVITIITAMRTLSLAQWDYSVCVLTGRYH